MNIVTLIRKSDGIRFQGFLDWDGMSRQMNFYYYDEEKDGWTSDKLGNFKPIPLLSAKLEPLCETETYEGLEP
jgi:hypothetical protein